MVYITLDQLLVFSSCIFHTVEYTEEICERKRNEYKLYNIGSNNILGHMTTEGTELEGVTLPQRFSNSCWLLFAPKPL